MDKGDIADTETIIGGPPIPNYDERIDDLKELTNLHAFYSFYPVFVTVVIIIWVMVIANLFNWILGLFLTTLAFIILYGFSILYRIQIQALNNKEE